MTNLTAQRVQELNRVYLSQLPLDDAVKQVKGDGSRQLVVFEDPNCVYCKRLHETFAELDDLTVYSLMFPILARSEEHTSELQSRGHLVCRLLLEKKKAPSLKIEVCSTLDEQ